MLHLLVSVFLTPLAVAEVPLNVGSQLTFRGSVEADDAAKGGKEFDLTLWVARHNATGCEVSWLIEERGRGEFPWPERFGRATFDAQWHPSGPAAAVLFDRGEGRSAVEVALPFLVGPKELAMGTQWSEGKLQFEVEKPSKVADRPAWKIQVRDAFGPKRVLWREQNGPLLLNQTERLTMGRGEPYQLKLEFASQDTIANEPLAALNKTIEQLATLRGQLKLVPRAQEIEWSPEQLKLLGEQLPAVAETALATPLSKLVEAAHRDLKSQTGRVDAVAGLRAKYANQPVEAFSAKGFGDDALDLDGLGGRVTVLHFWDYRDEPLKEPYGQVGYLDFLYQRRKASGLQVYGVAVDGRLADEKTRGASERSVKKLKAFMNLSYPIVLDSGALLKQFGDPRVVGASLPLFVVIGPDRKILHYHPGHYDVDRDQGLKELDAVVGTALEKK